MTKIDQKKILVTGGSGLLGGELRQLIPQALFPTREEFDITDPAAMNEYLGSKEVELILHAAAFTSPPKVDEDPIRGIDVNIVGTANVAKICHRKNIKLVYVSTDYVFKGDEGGYKEDDPVLPVNNYAWSKLGGECVVRMCQPHLIVRTSFGPNEFPYPKAFVDQWTSRETVSVIARKIWQAIQCGVDGVLHVGSTKRTVYDYAKETSPEKEIGHLSIKDVAFNPPVDTSLDTSKFSNLIEAAQEMAKEKS